MAATTESGETGLGEYEALDLKLAGVILGGHLEAWTGWPLEVAAYGQRACSVASGLLSTAACAIATKTSNWKTILYLFSVAEYENREARGMIM